jgi:hypothetical protein
LLAFELDDPSAELPPPADFGLVSTLHLRSSDFSQSETQAINAITDILLANPHITLQIVLESIRHPERLRAELLQKIMAVCYGSTSYLDRFYSLQPGHLLGAKRLFVLLDIKERPRLGHAWINEIGQLALLLWHGHETPSTPLEEFENFLPSPVGGHHEVVEAGGEGIEIA